MPAKKKQSSEATVREIRRRAFFLRSIWLERPLC